MELVLILNYGSRLTGGFWEEKTKFLQRLMKCFDVDRRPVCLTALQCRMVCMLGVATLPGSLLEMQRLGPHPRYSESELAL